MITTLTSSGSRSPTLLLAGLLAWLFALIIAGCPMPALTCATPSRICSSRSGARPAPATEFADIPQGGSDL